MKLYYNISRDIRKRICTDLASHKGGNIQTKLPEKNKQELETRDLVKTTGSLRLIPLTN